MWLIPCDYNFSISRYAQEDFQLRDVKLMSESAPNCDCMSNLNLKIKLFNAGLSKRSHDILLFDNNSKTAKVASAIIWNLRISPLSKHYALRYILTVLLHFLNRFPKVNMLLPVPDFNALIFEGLKIFALWEGKRFHNNKLFSSHWGKKTGCSQVLLKSVGQVSHA